MTVNTAKVVGRRSLRFHSFEEVLEDAERLVSGKTQQLGNWSLGQILKHLAVSMDQLIDGSDYRAPWMLRLAASLMKNRLLSEGMTPGFQIPRGLQGRLVPGESISANEGLAAYREAVRRYQAASELQPHPAFGQLTRDQADQLHLRHAELHLSFVRPEE